MKTSGAVVSGEDQSTHKNSCFKENAFQRWHLCQLMVSLHVLAVDVGSIQQNPHSVVILGCCIIHC